MKTLQTLAPQNEHSLELRERAGRCRLLSRLLAAPPDAAVLQDAQDAGFLDAGWEENVESLQIEFSTLFSVPGPSAIPAHQSIYTDVLCLEPSGRDHSGCGLSFAGGEFSGYLGGPTTSDMKRWYEAVHFQPRNTSHAMADHISTQLDFIARLFLLEAQASESDQVEEAQSFQELRELFYAQYLGLWLKKFSERLGRQYISAFYRRIGRALLATFQEA